MQDLIFLKKREENLVSGQMGDEIFSLFVDVQTYSDYF